MSHLRNRAAFGAASPGALARALVALALPVLGAAFAAPATAAEFSIGASVGADHGKTDCVPAYDCDHNSAFASVFGGARIADAVDVRLSFFDAGSFKGGDTTPLGTQFGGKFKVYGFALTAGYRWDFAPRWSLAARGGVAGVHTTFDYAGPFSGDKSKTEVEPTGGLGIAYAITPALRVGVDWDITRFKVHTKQGGLQMLGASVQYAF